MMKNTSSKAPSRSKKKITEEALGGQPFTGAEDSLLEQANCASFKQCLVDAILSVHLLEMYNIVADHIFYQIIFLLFSIQQFVGQCGFGLNFFVSAHR